MEKGREGFLKRLILVALCFSAFFLEKEAFYRLTYERIPLFLAGSFLSLSNALCHLGSRFHFFDLSKREWEYLGRELKKLSSTLLKNDSSPFFINGKPQATQAWDKQREFLEGLPLENEEELKLVHFLKNRFLAKADGFYQAEINWIAPLFRLPLQVHPKTTNCYARDPFTKMSASYETSLSLSKKLLPQPEEMPLLLTRPFAFSHASGGLLTFQDLKDVTEETLKRPILLDLTSKLPTKKEGWESSFKRLKDEVLAEAKRKDLPLEHLICIQRSHLSDFQALRILPLEESLKKDEWLQKWISVQGLTANQVEIDRLCFANFQSPEKRSLNPIFSMKEWALFFQALRETFFKDESGMSLGTLNVLMALLEEGLQKNRPLSYLQKEIAEKSCREIKRLFGEMKEDQFSEKNFLLEQVHGHLMTLLELISPFTHRDFQEIYESILTFPNEFKSFSFFGLHSSAMTSLSSLISALEKGLSRPIHILYGKNTYFECIEMCALQKSFNSLENATIEDFKKVDLLICQFQPVWQRDLGSFLEYSLEDVEGNIERVLKGRERPLMVALDETVDALASKKTEKLLIRFKEEILTGKLGVFSFRSGLKFDMFGMDQYAGAPFFSIHRPVDEWRFIENLSKDVSLVTDNLSVNWFCLAYKHAFSDLLNYRGAVVKNTKALLERIPNSFFERGSEYQVVKFAKEVDPIFLDLKVSGKSHEIKAALIAGGSFFLHSWENRVPIFYRRSIGFYHANFGMLFGNKSSTIRLTLGVDPDQVEIYRKCFQELDLLNSSNFFSSSEIL